MNPFKQILLDIIDFVRYKVEADACTPKEMQSVFKLLSEQTLTKATTKDIAEFYGQSPSNVRNIVSRWGVKSESQRVYDFAQLQKHLPKSWRKAKREADTATLHTGYYTPADYNLAAEESPVYGVAESNPAYGATESDAGDTDQTNN